MLFYRLLERAVDTGPAPYKDIIGDGLNQPIATQSDELY